MFLSSLSFPPSFSSIRAVAVSRNFSSPAMMESLELGPLSELAFSFILIHFTGLTFAFCITEIILSTYSVSFSSPITSSFSSRASSCR